MIPILNNTACTQRKSLVKVHITKCAMARGEEGAFAGQAAAAAVMPRAREKKAPRARHTDKGNAGRRNVRNVHARPWAAAAAAALSKNPVVEQILPFAPIDNCPNQVDLQYLLLYRVQAYI